jgi:hypothetical protein
VEWEGTIERNPGGFLTDADLRSLSYADYARLLLRKRSFVDVSGHSKPATFGK